MTSLNTPLSSPGNGLIQVDPLASNCSWNSSHVSTAASNVAEARWADQTTIVRLAGWEKIDPLCNMHVSRELVDKSDSTKLVLRLWN